jgi:aspartate kinase
MSNSPNRPLVAKFGGTSMARPDIVRQRIAEHQPNVVVVSAAGKDPEYRTKITDHLINYDARPSREGKEAIVRRLCQVASLVLGQDQLGSVEQYASQELDAAVLNGDSIPALGEQWSGRPIAQATGYEYIDAREIIKFAEPGVLDTSATDTAVRQRLDPSGHYVVPGFYGVLPNGHTTTFERGGSDITGAIIAKAMNAAHYQNWSDVEGYYSTNPSEYAGAQPVGNLSYLESRELANGGSELLHPEVAKALGSTSVITSLYSTFSGRSHTSISRARQWRDVPIVGISGRQHMLELRLSQFGIEEEAGKTADLYDILKDEDIPYRHAATSVDNLSLYLDGSHQAKLESLFGARADISISPTAMLHIVGEAMVRDPFIKMRTITNTLGALASSSIALHGMTDIGTTASTTLFVSPSDYIEGLGILHQKLLETQ